MIKGALFPGSTQNFCCLTSAQKMILAEAIMNLDPTAITGSTFIKINLDILELDPKITVKKVINIIALGGMLWLGKTFFFMTFIFCTTSYAGLFILTSNTDLATC